MTTRHTTFAGTFQVDSMPQQPQLALCHGFFVPMRQRGRKLAHKLKLQQMQYLAGENFDFAVATVDGANIAMQKVMEGAGWQRLAEFPNSRTGGSTQIWGAKVGDGAPAKEVTL